MHRLEFALLARRSNDEVPLAMPLVSPATWIRLIIPLAAIAISASTAAASPGASAAAAIASQLNPNLTSLTDYTEYSDPEHLLGLPGQYTSKAQFADNNQVIGIVEVFASHDDLNSRVATLEFGLTSQEVDLQSPKSTVLVRLFASDSDAQARATTFYSAAMATLGLT